MPSLDLSIDERHGSGMVALLGIGLVSQVLDEAVIIANAANESGQPWQYLTLRKSLNPDNFCESLEEPVSFETSKGDSGVMEKDDQATNIATSTPQKIKVETDDEKPDSSFIGQGDEDFYVRKDDVNNSTGSTSLFINQLFDMSNVEEVIISSEETINDNMGTGLVSQAMMDIMDSYVNAACNIALDPQLAQIEVIDLEEQYQEIEGEKYYAEQTCLSLLAEALDGNIGKDIDDDNPSTDEEKNMLVLEDDHVNQAEVLEDDDGNPPEIVVEEIIDEQTGIRDVIIIEEYATESQSEKGSCHEETTLHLDEPLEGDVVVIQADINDVLENNDVTQYGNLYSTLNRDEQCSEEDEPVLQGFQNMKDNNMTMQEIELLTANTSEENLSSKPDRLKDPKELTATSNVSAMSGKSLAQRWRSQGARLLSCLRGWWRRKTPGKRKGKLQRHGSVRGMCPLSADARRRATSLMDQRVHSPTASRSGDWRFNTINETVVNSDRYKDYTFDKTEECHE